mgnify:FL=1
MGNIVLLDELTINQIAAGEVIERPASVVKELVENSIDAGATSVSVEIKNGGISYIRITDNGKGIMPDDMDMAFERHATSKIRKAEDLETVTSMGFRGEALASIASISHVEVVSKALGNDIGCRVEMKGGNMLNKEEAGCPQGTTITVTDLFYNTPVRYKFLKKDFTEAGYIEDVITRIALVHPEIAIKLINSGKTIIQTPGNGELKTVIYNIYGKDIAENIINVDYTYDDIRVTGVIGKPVIARSNRSNQLFFVNKRYIKDKALTSAAEQGYKGMITIGKYAFLVLNLEMDPKKVDVNVHPAKLEVRFDDEGKVFKAIYHTIKENLLKDDLVPDKTRIEIHKQEEKEERQREEKPVAPQVGWGNMNSSNNFIAQIYNQKHGNGADENNNEKTDTVNENQNINEEKNKAIEAFRNEYNAQILENKPAINVVDDTAKIDIPNELKKEETQKVEIPVLENVNNSDETKVIDLKEVNEKLNKLSNLQVDANYQDFDEMYARTFGIQKKEEKVQGESNEYKFNAEELKPASNMSIFEKDEEGKVPDYKFIGIAFSTFIIIELDKELYIIDQHAAHERIMYEKIKKNYYSDTDKDSQLMLLPDIINLSHRDMEIAKDNMDVFRKAGFVLEEFGENTIKLTGVPNVCLDLDTKELFLETLDEINTVARTAKQEIEEKFIATVACKAAVKANMALTREEVDNLMSQLLVLPNPFTCPHGRPTAIRMTRYDIERKFSRK